MEPEARQNPCARGTCALLIDEPDAHRAGARAEIQDALARRAVPVRSCADRFEAVALAVLAEESRRAGEAGASPTVLILTAEQARRYGGTLHDALLRTAPHSAIWVHDPSGSPPLAAFRGPGPTAEGRGAAVVVRDAARQMGLNPRPQRSAGPPSIGAPHLKLSGEGPPEAPPGASPRDAEAAGTPEGLDEAPHSISPLLSAEELAMLLSDDWGPGRAGGGGGGA